jgi:hypothetical protein
MSVTEQIEYYKYLKQINSEDYDKEKHKYYKTRSRLNYGEIARVNGDLFEKKVCDFYNNSSPDRKKLISKLKEKYKDLEENGKFFVYDKKKVKSIYSKKTTRKADIYYETEKYKIGISVKMSNRGTQLQIISLDNFILYLKNNGIKMTTHLEEIFKKFLGIKPATTELLNKDNKNKQRWWFHELEEKDRNETIKFLQHSYDIIMKFIYCKGMCIDKSDMAKFFIINNSYYTKTNQICPIIYNYEEMLKLVRGVPKITKKGNLELSPCIGLQRKGSGRGTSAQCLQFKDRGLKNKMNIK